MQAKTVHLDQVSQVIISGRGAWPPASPWVWQDSWWQGDNEYSLILSVRFDSPVNGTGTLVLQGLDYDIDPNCPWRWLIVVKPDGTRVTQQIPQGGRTGTVGAAALATKGLTSFNDLGSITAGATQN